MKILFFTIENLNFYHFRLKTCNIHTNVYKTFSIAFKNILKNILPTYEN